MILTFDLATWFLFATHRPVMMIICAKLFLNLIKHNKVMGQKRTGSTEILTFDLATWFLIATNRLVMMIICVKLISDPIM